MAKSKASKRRQHAVRNGKRDVTQSRGGQFLSISTHERKNKTLQDRKSTVLSKELHRMKKEYA